MQAGGTIDPLSRIASALVRNESAETFPEALEILREASGAESAFAFVAAGSHTLRLVSYVSSREIDEGMTVAVGDAPIDDDWFPSELPTPAAASTFALENRREVKSLIVLSFDASPKGSVVDAVRAAAMLIALALFERQSRRARESFELAAYQTNERIGRILHDVTSRMRVENELRERGERFALVALATEETIWDWNLQTGSAWHSSAIEIVFGFPRSEVRPDIDWWFERMHAEDVEHVRNSIHASISRGEPFWSAEYRVRAGDGRYVSVLDRGSILRDDRGRPVRMIGARMDITLRKEAERELETSREESRELARRLISIQEEERRSIARDVHDTLGQSLTAIKIDALSLGSNRRIVPAARARANRIASIVDEMVKSVRSMSSRLRPIVLDDLGLLPALSHEARAFTERTGIVCSLVSRVEELELDGELSTAIFRIVQEALTNVARHSRAERARIEIYREPTALCVEIGDDGRGIAANPGDASLGILGMKERALLIGAELSIARASTTGTIVALRIPLPQR